MIYNKTSEGARLMGLYRKELEALTTDFFSACKGKKPNEVNIIYLQKALDWTNFCKSINRIKNWPVRMTGDEFAAVTREAYVKIFLTKGNPKGRRMALRTVRIIEQKPLFPFLGRLIKLKVKRLFS